MVKSPMTSTIEETAEEGDEEDETSSAGMAEETGRSTVRRGGYGAVGSAREGRGSGNAIPLMEFEREPGSKKKHHIESDV